MWIRKKQEWVLSSSGFFKMLWLKASFQIIPAFDFLII